MKKALSLNEGLRQGDLSNLVLPLISVDEYESQVDSEQAIVIGFYVHDEAAAKDLNRYLQKSAVPLLGTDVSPAPDQHGYFLVFVEFMDNDRLGENLASILHEMGTLVGIDDEDWQLRVRATKHIVPFTVENLQTGVAKAKHTSKKSNVIEYLQQSSLHNAEFENSLLILEGAGERHCFDFIDLGEIDDVMQSYHLTETGMKYDIRNIAKTNKIIRMLGENWEANNIAGFVMLTRDEDSRALLLKV